jgi:hypothetical protein
VINPVDRQDPFQQAPQALSSRALWLKALPCLMVLLAVLFYFPLSTLNGAGLTVMVLAVSWCLYQYFLPLHLIRRRALLEYMTSDGSVLRRWLWQGVVSRFLLLLWCVILAVSVLLLSASFSQAEWLVLLINVPVLLLLIPPALRWSGSESDQVVHLPLALRVAVYLTIMLSTLGLIVVQMLGEGVPDTRQLSLLQVITQSWTSALEAANLPMIGWLSGVEVVMSNSVWHLMQQASTLSEQSAALKLAAWLLFLLFITVRAALMWFVLAGVLSWLLKAGRRGDRLSSAQHSGVHFVSGVSVLAIVSLILAQPGVTAFVSRLADQSMLALPIPAPDSCIRLAPIELAQFEQRSRNALHDSSLLWQQDIELQLDAALDKAFGQLEPAVDSYLDWNFSIGGQYLQLGYLLSAMVETGFDQTGSASLEQRFSGYVSAKIDEHISPVLSPALQQARVDLQQQFDHSAHQFYVQQAVKLEQLMASSSCLLPVLPPLAMPELINKSAVGVGPVVGLLATRLAAQGGARVGSKVLTRNASKRIVSASAAKVSTKVAQSSGAGSLGISCGALAPVCVPVLFVATWLGTDFLINKFDEANNRPQMREDLLAALDAEKQQMRAQYLHVFDAGITQLLAELQVHSDQRFNILRDGI